MLLKSISEHFKSSYTKFFSHLGEAPGTARVRNKNSLFPFFWSTPPPPHLTTQPITHQSLHPPTGSIPQTFPTQYSELEVTSKENFYSKCAKKPKKHFFFFRKFIKKGKFQGQHLVILNGKSLIFASILKTV